MNQQNPHPGWVLRIRYKSGFLRFTTLAVFWGKGFQKSIFDKRFFEKKNGTQQMSYIYDILTEPIYVGGALTFSYMTQRRLR